MLLFCEEIIHREIKIGSIVHKVVQHKYNDHVAKIVFSNNFLVKNGEYFKYSSREEAIEAFNKLVVDVIKD